MPVLSLPYRTYFVPPSPDTDKWQGRIFEPVCYLHPDFQVYSAATDASHLNVKLYETLRGRGCAIQFYQDHGP
jgi:hypothetical protein